MKMLHRLIPAFLQRLDRSLQQNHPRLWSTRLHLHLWFLFLANGLVFALGLVITVQPRRFPDPEELWGYMMLPAAVYLAFWIHRVALFTVERRFGQRHSYAEVGEFMIHWVSVLLILSLPYNLALTIAARTDHLVTDEEFVHQVNVLNEQAPWFYGTQNYYGYEEDTYEEGPVVAMRVQSAMDQAAEAMMAATKAHLERRQAQGSGTHEFFRSLDEFAQRNLSDNSGVRTERPLHSIYTDYVDVFNAAVDPDDTATLDPDTAALYAQRIDSIEKRFPLLLTDPGPHTPYAAVDVLPFLSDSTLEMNCLAARRANAPPDRAALAEAMAIGNRYSARVSRLPVDTVLKEFAMRRTSSSGLGIADYRIDRIAKAKTLHYVFMKGELIFYGLLITCFVLTLLLSIFKNIYWQPFLIAWVTAALLPIVLFILALLTEHGVFAMSEEKIMMWAFYWIAVLLVISLFFVPSLKAYRTTSAVMTILANVSVPFLAVFTVFLLDQEFDVFGQRALMDVISEMRANNSADPRIVALELQLDTLRDRVMMIIQLALWGGLAAYILVLHPLFRNLYTRLFALPERK